MWAIHDDIRAPLKKTRAALADDEAALAVSAALEVATIADDMVTKEEKVLFPMALETLSDEEWGADPRRRGARSATPSSPTAGVAGGARPPRRRPRPPVARSGAPDGAIRLQTGALTAEQLGLMLTACRSTSASSTRTTTCASTARANASSRARRA